MVYRFENIVSRRCAPWKICHRFFFTRSVQRKGITCRGFAHIIIRTLEVVGVGASRILTLNNYSRISHWMCFYHILIMTAVKCVSNWIQIQRSRDFRDLQNIIFIMQQIRWKVLEITYAKTIAPEDYFETFPTPQRFFDIILVPPETTENHQPEAKVYLHSSICMHGILISLGDPGTTWPRAPEYYCNCAPRIVSNDRVPSC